MAATMMMSASMSVGATRSLPATQSSSRKTSPNVAVRKVKNFSGLKPEMQTTRLGLVQSTEAAFAAVRARCSGRPARGGALAANCDVASEIFRIVPIMSALTLIGIAIGFVLLRVEAAVEESE